MSGVGAARAVAYYTVAIDARPADDERRALARFVREHGLVLVEPFVEMEGGRERSQLARALARCRELGALLVIPSLASAARDRLFLDAVLDARVRVVAMDRKRVGRRTLELLRDVAHARRARAAARSREALRAARARGARIGSPRPEVGARRAGTLLCERADRRARLLAPLIEELQLSNPGISLRGLAQLLEAQRIPTPRGGSWGPSTVRNLIVRASS